MALHEHPTKRSKAMLNCGVGHGHEACDLVPVSGSGGNGVKLWCPVHKVLLDAEGIGSAMSVQQSALHAKGTGPAPTPPEVIA